jgi:hypothetical protein
MKSLSISVLTLSLILAITSYATTASASTCTEIIREADIVRQAEDTPPTGPWVLYTRTPSSSGTFAVTPVIAPGTAPFAIGSLRLSTPSGTDKVTLFNYGYMGTLLSNITSLGYSTYRDPSSTATPVQLPSLNLQVDYNGSAPGGFTTLVFEPVYNADQGSVTSGTWQTWDALNGGNGIWWSTQPINGVCATSCYVTWNQILAANPDAVIIGGVGVNQGSGNGGLIAFVDALTIGTTTSCTWTYDFEPEAAAPVTPAACRNGGWQTLRRANGTAFKNQGDCMQYAQTGK